MKAVINTIELESVVTNQLNESTKVFGNTVGIRTAITIAQTAIWKAVNEINNNPDKYIL